MTTDQWLRGLPYVGIGVVLVAFGVAAWVRASRRDQPVCWPLTWGRLSAVFLISLGVQQFYVSLRVFLSYPERWERRAGYGVLWVVLAICAWTLRRWLREGDEV